MGDLAWVTWHGRFGWFGIGSLVWAASRRFGIGDLAWAVWHRQFGMGNFLLYELAQAN